MSGSITVTMYDVGFGDSFLLAFPAVEGRRPKVLVDCGVHQKGPGPFPMKEIVAAILEDVVEADGSRIDVVIATHRHRDHVFGFERPEWSGVRVGEVWMPWTEHPDDPQARMIREAQAKKAKDLALAFASLDIPAADREMLLAIAENNLTNAKAMETLHHGFTGNPQRSFLPQKTGPRSFSTPLLPGAIVHVLGPSRDPDVMRDMNPPPHGSFLRAPAGAAGGAGPSPFATRWQLSPEGDAFETWWSSLAKKRVAEPDDAPLLPSDAHFAARWLGRAGLTKADVRSVEKKGRDDPFAAAVALDAAVNGTSLMLTIELGKAILLLPGDAQWGTWNAAMSDATSLDLLKRTTFYKVGHHASHNATPRRFVDEIIGAGVLAMISTRTKTFDSIPRLPLLAALKKKAVTFVRSDDGKGSVVAPFKRVDPIRTTIDILV